MLRNNIETEGIYDVVSFVPFFEKQSFLSNNNRQCTYVYLSLSICFVPFDEKKSFVSCNVKESYFELIASVVSRYSNILLYIGI